MGNADFDVNLLGSVGEDLDKISPVDDGTTKANRSGRYGDFYNIPIVGTSHPLAREGSYFTTTVSAAGGTPGTAIAQTTSITSFTATNAVVCIQNNDTIGRAASQQVYVDMI